MEKKTLVRTPKSTKKANLAVAPAKNEGASTRKVKAIKKMYIKVDY